MNVGKINSNVGHPKALSGTIRELNVTEQLKRVVMYPGINSVTHPVHGRVEVKGVVAKYLLENFSEDDLVNELELGSFNR